MNEKAMFKISYGLFVLTAQENNIDNGCIVNTVGQVTNTPNRISVTVNKQNHTHDMISRTGIFNVSILAEDSKFDTFKHFGFQSGKDVKKFEGQMPVTFARSSNGLCYILDGCNSYISARVISSTDLGTHTMFIADVTDCEILTETTSLTYNFYQSHIKPAPTPQKKKGFVCTICGYIYEGDTLPSDFICPWCKHPASDFIPLEDK